MPSSPSDVDPASIHYTGNEVHARYLCDRIHPQPPVGIAVGAVAVAMEDLNLLLDIAKVVVKRRQQRGQATFSGIPVDLIRGVYNKLRPTVHTDERL